AFWQCLYASRSADRLAIEKGALRAAGLPGNCQGARMLVRAHRELLYFRKLQMLRRQGNRKLLNRGGYDLQEPGSGSTGVGGAEHESPRLRNLDRNGPGGSDRLPVESNL